MTRAIYLTPLFGLFLLGCPEVPQCVENPISGAINLECNYLLVPACGDDPETLYNATGLDGNLLPASTNTETGSCEGFEMPCRPVPVCGTSADQAPTCADGSEPRCVRGAFTAATMPAPPMMPEPPMTPADAGM